MKPFSPINSEIRHRSLWKGPYVDGVTQSLLQKFIVCRHRFYLQVVEGLQEDLYEFPKALEYGSLWHEAEAAWAETHNFAKAIEAVQNYATKLLDLYPNCHTEIHKWKEICCYQFPIYINHYQNKQKKRDPIMQEENFEYKFYFQQHSPNYPLLRSRRPHQEAVILRGKFDAVFRDSSGLWLQENKVKWEIDIESLTYTINQDLQTCIYLLALQYLFPKEKIRGVIYNVVRRPLSFGSYQIVKRKGRKTKDGIKGAETDDQYYRRIQKTIQKDPGHYFQRFPVYITPSDLTTFCHRMLTPLLTELCIWWDSLQNLTGPFQSPYHWQTPYGIFNPLFDGRRGEYFEYLAKGHKAGLHKISTLFPELET